MTIQSPGPPPRIGVVILGAGRSTRMGTAKLLLPWGKTTIVGHLIGEWAHLKADQITVVCAADDLGMREELSNVGFSESNRILNPTPEAGMFMSIRRAAQWQGWKEDLTHWTIVLGDQPHLGRATLRSLLLYSALHPEYSCQPRYGGHGRHPVIFPKAVFGRLAMSEAATLKVFLGTEAVRFCDLCDPALELDIDTPQDYQKALAIYSQGSSVSSSL